jgi:hypothetical protein
MICIVLAPLHVALPEIAGPVPAYVARALINRQTRSREPGRLRQSA